MSVVVEKPYTVARNCPHGRTTLALLPCNGGPQIRRTCVDCGKRVGGPEPRSEHPRWREYPTILLAGESPRLDERQVESSAYADYLASPEWAAKRAYYIGKALHRCQLCNRAGGPSGKGLQVHHRTYQRVGAELDCDVVVLCADCHSRHHGHIGEHAA